MLLKQQALIDFLASDYLTVIVKQGRICAIARMAFTFALVADCDWTGYGERWCYDSLAGARRALADWSGLPGTEPQGWHRHPGSGRRRPDGDEAREVVCP